MSYATQADMESRFGPDELIQITDKEGLGVVNDETFAQAQLDGDADIDARLQLRFPDGLPSVPNVLKRISCDIYRYYLYGARVTELVEKRYNAAIKFLDALVKGDVSIGLDAAGQQPPAAEPDRVQFNAAERTFTSDNLSDY